MRAAAILAGGRARRFGGRDKSALPIGRARIIDRQIAVLRQVADHLLIVADAPERFAGLGVPVVQDLIAGAGPLGGIYTALLAAPCQQSLVVACDMPFLQARFLDHVLAAGRDVDVAIPRTLAGYQPLCASYARRSAAAIRRQLDAGVLRLTDLLAGLRVREIGPDEIAGFDPDGTLFLNVNTPEDYARALDLLERETG